VLPIGRVTAGLDSLSRLGGSVKMKFTSV
jgi:hypothetical protein